MDTEKTKAQRLSDALLEFIERETKEPSSDAATAILPAMAQALTQLITGEYC